MTRLGLTGMRLHSWLVLWAGLGLALSASAVETIRISGTGSGVGGMKLLADAFMSANPDVKVEVLTAISSTGGISALIGGKLELALSNRLPNEKESALVPLTTVEYARTAFVVAVHRNLGVTALSEAEFAALYAEGSAKFPNGARARPVLRLSDATDTKLMRSFVPEAAIAIDQASIRRGMLSANTDSETADLIENVPGAFSGVTLAQIASEGRPFVALSIGGKVASNANLAAGLYPQFKHLYLTSSANAAPATRRFIAFVGAPAARALLAGHGHLPR